MMMRSSFLLVFGAAGKTEHREQRLDHLDNQPRRNDVGRCYTQHVATLEFIDE